MPLLSCRDECKCLKINFEPLLLLTSFFDPCDLQLLNDNLGMQKELELVPVPDYCCNVYNSTQTAAVKSLAKVVATELFNIDSISNTLKARGQCSC